MSSTAPQVRELVIGETLNCIASVKGKLSYAETATGTPTVIQDSKSPSSATDLTLGSKVVNTAPQMVDDGTGQMEQVEIGEAIQFTATGGSDGATYSIKMTFSTSGGQTKIGYVTILGVTK